MNIHLGGVAHAFNPSTWEAEQGDLCEFSASLVYRVSSRTAGATGRPCLKQKRKIEYLKSGFYQWKLRKKKRVQIFDLVSYANRNLHGNALIRIICLLIY